MFPLYDENKSRTSPFITWTIIVITSLVFCWEFMLDFDLKIFYDFGEIPVYILQGKHLLSVLTSLFLHSDFWHIFGNMFYLFIFGDNVEDRFGHTKHLFLYFVFGIVGGLTHSIMAVMTGGLEARIPMIGASGAVSGILGAYLVFFPKAKIVSIVPSFYFIRLARIPAVIFIGFWFILQLLYSGSVVGVAYMAHIGGFITGIIGALIVKLNDRNRKMSSKPVIRLPTTKHCIFCGTPLPETAVFCPKCGEKT